MPKKREESERATPRSRSRMSAAAPTGKKINRSIGFHRQECGIGESDDRQSDEKIILTVFMKPPTLAARCEAASVFVRGEPRWRPLAAPLSSDRSRGVDSFLGRRSL